MIMVVTISVCAMFEVW